MDSMSGTMMNTDVICQCCCFSVFDMTRNIYVQVVKSVHAGLRAHVVCTVRE